MDFAHALRRELRRLPRRRRHAGAGASARRSASTSPDRRRRALRSVIARRASPARRCPPSRIERRRHAHRRADRRPRRADIRARWGGPTRSTAPRRRRTPPRRPATPSAARRVVRGVLRVLPRRRTARAGRKGGSVVDGVVPRAGERPGAAHDRHRRPARPRHARLARRRPGQPLTAQEVTDVVAWLGRRSARQLPGPARMPRATRGEEHA